MLAHCRFADEQDQWEDVSRQLLGALCLPKWRASTFIPCPHCDHYADPWVMDSALDYWPLLAGFSEAHAVVSATTCLIVTQVHGTLFWERIGRQCTVQDRGHENNCSVGDIEIDAPCDNFQLHYQCAWSRNSPEISCRITGKKHSFSPGKCTCADGAGQQTHTTVHLVLQHTKAGMCYPVPP